MRSKGDREKVRKGVVVIDRWGKELKREKGKQKERMREIEFR